MTRLSTMLLAGSLALVAVGCTHCDTCDDFPTPCVGPNCGGMVGDQGTYTDVPVGGPFTTNTLPPPADPAIEAVPSAKPSTPTAPAPTLPNPATPPAPKAR